MENLDVKEKIAAIIQKDVCSSWEIVDSKPDENLYLIHFSDNSNRDEYGHLRGLIVDIKSKTIVCSGYKYTPVVRDTDHLSYDEQGKMTLIDSLGNSHTVDKNKVKIVPGFEVLTIRVFLHNGNVYYSSYRKIDIFKSKSHWGNSKTFDEMSVSLKMPEAGELFPDKTKLYSNYAHIFMIVHPDILNVSRDNIKNGFILYAGTKNLWSPGTVDYPIDKIDTTPVNLEVTPDLNVAKDSLVLYQPKDFTLDQANYFLKYGYYNSQDSDQSDIRTSGGEFVIMYLNDGNNPFDNVIRVQSTAYCWRSYIKDDHPNIKYQFYKLLDAYRNYKYNDFNFPKFTKFEVKSIQKKIEESNIHFWPKGVPIYIKDKQDAYYVIWISLLLSVPLHKQKEVSQLYDEFFKDKKEIVGTLYEASQSGVLLNSEDNYSFHPRTYKLIELAKSRAIKNVGDGNIESDMKYNLDYLLNNEEGKSFYKIYKDCKFIKNKLGGTKINIKIEGGSVEIEQVIPG